MYVVNLLKSDSKRQGKLSKLYMKDVKKLLLHKFFSDFHFSYVQVTIFQFHFPDIVEFLHKIFKYFAISYVFSCARDLSTRPQAGPPQGEQPKAERARRMSVSEVRKARCRNERLGAQRSETQQRGMSEVEACAIKIMKIQLLVDYFPKINR